MASSDIEKGKGIYVEPSRRKEERRNAFVAKVKHSEARMHRNCCIFRVPAVIRRQKKIAYHPDIVSIGPFHRGGKEFQHLENVKKWYLNCFLERNTKIDLRSLMDSIMKDETNARNCYAESLNLDQQDFVEMLILDGCFLIELFLKFARLTVTAADKENKDDPIFHVPCMLLYLYHDLLLLENQLPWFVLEVLYNQIKESANQTKSLSEVVIDFFKNSVAEDIKIFNYPKSDSREILHILDLIRSSLVEPNSPPDQTTGNWLRKICSLCCTLFQKQTPIANRAPSSQRTDQILTANTASSRQTTDQTPIENASFSSQKTDQTTYLTQIANTAPSSQKTDQILTANTASSSQTTDQTPIENASFSSQKTDQTTYQTQIANTAPSSQKTDQILTANTASSSQTTDQTPIENASFSSQKTDQTTYQTQIANRASSSQKTDQTTDQTPISRTTSSSQTDQMTDQTPISRTTSSRQKIDQMAAPIGFTDSSRQKTDRYLSAKLPQRIPSAVTLSEAGVKFKKGTLGCILNITFEHGVFTIPPLAIDERTGYLFRNVMAYEQCYWNREHKITSYAVLMDSLIDTSKDVDLLCDKGIVAHWLSAEDASKFFNELYNDTTVIEYSYEELCERVENYQKVLWNRWREKLKRDYFGTPWATISFFAAFVLLVLTFLQTIYTIYPYYHPRD